MVLVVSGAYSDRDYHSWLQPAVNRLEDKLTSLNIGLSTPNRYAVVHFGGRGIYATARYITITHAGEMFFNSTSFHLAANELQILGAVADGYQAIEYALQNAVFRNVSGIAKMMLLIAKQERDNLITHSNLTKADISSLLRASNILFDSVVAVNLSVTTATANISVLGLSGYGNGVVPGRNGTHKIISGNATLMRNANSTLFHDYVTLALDLGGTSFSLDQLISSNANVIDSFVGALTSGHCLQHSRSIANVSNSPFLFLHVINSIILNLYGDVRVIYCGNCFLMQCNQSEVLPTEPLPTEPLPTEPLPTLAPSKFDTINFQLFFLAVQLELLSDIINKIVII